MVENKIAVDRNHAALKRILASLVAMAGWTAAGNTFCAPAAMRAAPVPSAPSLCRHPAAPASGRSRDAAAGHRPGTRNCRHAAAAAAAKPKPGPVLLKDGKGTGIVDTGISFYRLGLANVAPPPIVQKRTAVPTRPLAFPLLDPLRNPFPPAPAAARSRAPLCPVACTTSPGGMPFGCGSRRPMTRLTPRVSASALPRWPRRWTTCRPRLSASRAGAPAAIRCAGSHLPPADFAASGRCVPAARPVAACPASIRLPGG